ncbi:hypothetical protein LCGC14_2089750 [marine sediment metagenome]|uniref:Uncharacterized protein n=1 Tax=marine sediment metagenome TaxID=412755 RepID=A0A0F9GR99_9ZZZZ
MTATVGVTTIHPVPSPLVPTRTEEGQPAFAAPEAHAPSGAGEGQDHAETREADAPSDAGESHLILGAQAGNASPNSGGGNGQAKTAMEPHHRPACPPALLKIVHYAQLAEAAQKMRTGSQLRVSAYERDRGIVLDDSELIEQLAKLESGSTRYLKRALQGYPLGLWLLSIKGLGGGILAGKLLKRLGDLHRFPTVGALWRYCGLDGNQWREKEDNGKKHYSPQLLAILVGEQGIADQFVRHRTPGYREAYDERKVFEATKPACGKAKCVGETCTPGHIEARTKRYTVKRFLIDLWVEGTKEE